MQDLLHDLDAEFARDPAGPGVAKLLETFSASGRDWGAYALFGESPYVRNLVHLGEHYELIVICWNVGAASPIHDHSGQRCWMGGLQGEIQETHFDVPLAGSAPVARSTRILNPGQVAFITDEIALHEIRAVGAQRAASLHLYAQPIKTCKLYDRETGAIEERRLSYYSVQGELQLG